jgi:hypothetical protein
MPRMKKSLLILVLIMITGCREYWPEKPVFHWATIDKHKLESILLDTAKLQNPDPVELRSNEEGKYNKRNDIESQISKLEEIAHQRCMKPEYKEKLAQGRDFMCSRYHPLACQGVFDEECIAKIPQDPLIADIKKKAEESEKNAKLRQARERAKRAIATDTLTTVLSAYAEANKIDLIIDNREDAILFEKKGIAIDATQAVIAQIQTNTPNMKMTDQQIEVLGNRP